MANEANAVEVPLVEQIARLTARIREANNTSEAVYADLFGHKKVAELQSGKNQSPASASQMDQLVGEMREAMVLLRDIENNLHEISLRITGTNTRAQGQQIGGTGGASAFAYADEAKKFVGIAGH